MSCISKYFVCVLLNFAIVILVFGPPSYGGSYKITVVCLAVRLSVCLSISSAFSLGMGHYFFLLFLIFDRCWINGPKTRVFWIFWKILLLVFLENNLKWKLLLLLIFYHQSHIWKNSGSGVLAKMLFTNQVAGFFKM